MPVDQKQFWALVRATQWAEIIAEFRRTGDQSLKRKLPAFIFQAMFDETTSKAGRQGRWRKQAATRLTGLVVMDIDHIEKPREVFDSWLKVHGEGLKPLGILLVYITPSGKGLKVVFKADAAKGNLIDNQHAMAELLGVEVDESCKDASRMSFICREEDILFIDDELFTYENREFGEKYDESYRSGNSKSTDKGTRETKETVIPTLNQSNAPKEYHGIPYSKIVEAWVGDQPVEQGDRHRTSLILADHLRYITDNDAALIEQILRQTPFVAEIVKERNEDVAATVRSAQEYKFYKTIPKRMQEALIKAGAHTADAQSEQTVPSLQGRAEGGSGSGLEGALAAWGAQIEALFEDYPILKDICKGLKRSQYPAAVFVAGGFLMTLMTRCTYHFYHMPEVMRRLNCQTLIIGDPASGKSFATRLYKLLTAPIAEADREGKDAINAYRELMRTKGANKEKPKKPKVVVRIHPARTSNAQFIQDMVNAVEVVDGEPMQLHMLTFDSELDNTLSVQRGGAWIDKNSMELKAFHNEEDGQAYSNLDSILENFIVTWNYVCTGTPIALRKKVNASNVGSGLFTRLTVIPLPSTNFEMLRKQEHVDYEADERLKLWAQKLDRTKGELPLQRIVDELYDWTERRMKDAEENASRADELMLKRCAYHGLNFAAPFIVMRHWDSLKEEGTFYCGTFETDDTDWCLTELLLNIHYACQRHFFGHLVEEYFEEQDREASVNVQHRQKTILAFQQLPEEFTTKDVMRCFGLTNGSTIRMRISHLIKDQLIEKVSDGRESGCETSVFRKTGRIML